MAVLYKHPRGTRANLNTLATGSGLTVGQVYVITDENRLAVALTTSTYETYAKQSEAGGMTKIIATSDQTNNEAVANTLVANSQLVVPIAASQRRRVRYTIFYTAAATTTGSRWVLTGPAIGAGTIYGRSQYTLAATSITMNHFSAYNIPAASNASSVLAGNTCVIDAVIINGANAGNIGLAFASEITLSAIVLKAGSFVEYETF